MNPSPGCFVNVEDLTMPSVLIANRNYIPLSFGNFIFGLVMFGFVTLKPQEVEKDSNIKTTLKQNYFPLIEDLNHRLITSVVSVTNTGLAVCLCITSNYGFSMKMFKLSERA